MALDARLPPSSYVHERPTTTPVGHKRQRSTSTSNTMLNPKSWLKISTTPSQNGSSPTGLKISDPRLLTPVAEDGRIIGSLGSGAQVVRNAAQAWRHTTAPKSNISALSRSIVVEDSPLDPYGPDKSFLPSPGLGLTHTVPLTPPNEKDMPLRPIHSQPPVPSPQVVAQVSPQTPPLRSALKPFPVLPSPPLPQRAEPSTPLPSSPFLAQSTPAQPFSPILLSSVPQSVIDHSQLLVSIETTSATFKTTYTTLTSRKSRLQAYLASLLPEEEHPAPSSPSSFSTIFHTHLAAQGLLPASSTSISLFLDRPSGPYPHILSYLRSSDATLPRAVQLQPSSTSRLEALLELRDEAKYLELEELYKLCCDEITRPKPGHMRSSSAGTQRVRDTVRFASSASLTKYTDVSAAMERIKSPLAEEEPSALAARPASSGSVFPRTSNVPAAAADWI